MFQVIILCLAVCTDAFVASICYGADGIRINVKKMGIMNGIGSVFLGAALLFGGLLRQLVPDSLTRAVCFVSLFLLGVLRLSDSLIRSLVCRLRRKPRDFSFSFSGLRFLLTICQDPAAADRDHSRTLSVKETVCFGTAMSFDSLAAGAAAAFMEVPVWATVLTVFWVGMSSMFLGQLLGRRLQRRLRGNLSWAGGVFYLVLAFSRLGQSRFF